MPLHNPGNEVCEGLPDVYATRLSRGVLNAPVDFTSSYAVCGRSRPE